MRSFQSKHMLLCLVSVLAIESCRANRVERPEVQPDFRGQIVGPSFESGAPGFGQLTLLRIAASSSADGPSLGFARIDGSTRFVLSKVAAIDSSQIGLPGLQWAYVRVWYRGAPTSKTDTEFGEMQLSFKSTLWGNDRQTMAADDELSNHRPLCAEALSLPSNTR